MRLACTAAPAGTNVEQRRGSSVEHLERSLEVGAATSEQSAVSCLVERVADIVHEHVPHLCVSSMLLPWQFLLQLSCARFDEQRRLSSSAILCCVKRRNSASICRLQLVFNSCCLALSVRWSLQRPCCRRLCCSWQPLPLQRLRLCMLHRMQQHRACQHVTLRASLTSDCSLPCNTYSNN